MRQETAKLTEPKRSSDGKFLPGSSGNPYGRPHASRNRSSQLVEALLDGKAEALAAKVIERALGGDTLALKLCLERLVPARRERHMVLELPPPATARDITAGFGRIVQALGAGDLTPTETDSLAALLDNARRAIETTELARRIGELESRIVHEQEARHGVEAES